MERKHLNSEQELQDTKTKLQRLLATGNSDLSSVADTGRGRSALAKKRAASRDDLSVDELKCASFHISSVLCKSSDILRSCEKKGRRAVPCQGWADYTKVRPFASTALGVLMKSTGIFLPALSTMTTMANLQLVMSRMPFRRLARVSQRNAISVVQVEASRVTYPRVACLRHLRSNPEVNITKRASRGASDRFPTEQPCGTSEAPSLRSGRTLQKYATIS